MLVIKVVRRQDVELAVIHVITCTERHYKVSVRTSTCRAHSSEYADSLLHYIEPKAEDMTDDRQ